MDKGSRSGKILKVAFDLSLIGHSEITAFTSRLPKEQDSWTDNVSYVTDVFRRGQASGIRVIPRIVTSTTAREAIVEETEHHSYDLVFLAVSRRSPLSGALFGSVGDYVFRKVNAPTVIMSVQDMNYPYSSVVAPVSERVNTKFSISLALMLSKAIKTPLVLPDLRRYDGNNRTHRFRALLNNIKPLRSELGNEIVLVRPAGGKGILNDLASAHPDTNSAVAVVGIQPGNGGSLRVNSEIKEIVKFYPGDVIVARNS